MGGPWGHQAGGFCLKKVFQGIANWLGYIIRCKKKVICGRFFFFPVSFLNVLRFFLGFCFAGEIAHMRIFLIWVVGFPWSLRWVS